MERKKELLRRIGEIRLRPVDIVRMTGGYVSHSEAKRWLDGHMTKGVVLLMERVCDEVHSKWEQWQDGRYRPEGHMAEIIVRAYRVVEKVEATRWGAQQGPVLPEAKTNIAKSVQPLTEGKWEHDDDMYMTRRVQGADTYFCAEGPVGFCKTAALEGRTHVSFGKEEFAVGAFRCI